MTTPRKFPVKNAAQPPPPPAPAPAKKTAADSTELLFVWAVPTKNQTILTAYRPQTDPNDPNNLVTVRVRANWNFMPHMRIRASRVSANTYDLVGPLPRWKGRF